MSRSILKPDYTARICHRSFAIGYSFGSDLAGKPNARLRLAQAIRHLRRDRRNSDWLRAYCLAMAEGFVSNGGKAK